MSTPSISDLQDASRDDPDFPKDGILFKDLTPLLGDPKRFRGSLEHLAATAGDTKIDKVIGIDARGFIFAAGVAQILGAGFVPVRKKGKLPWTTREMAYSLEYGEATVEIHDDAIRPGDNILLVDDLLATGGTAAAALKLLKAFDGNVVGASFLIELSFLGGANKLDVENINALITY